jgi:hypothetical protein
MVGPPPPLLRATSNVWAKGLQFGLRIYGNNVIIEDLGKTLPLLYYWLIHFDFISPYQIKGFDAKLWDKKDSKGNTQATRSTQHLQLHLPHIFGSKYLLPRFVSIC